MNFIREVMIRAFHDQRGVSLIEVLIALGIIAVGFGGMAILAGRSVSVIRDARANLIAANLAQEGVEIIRNLRDQNWIEENRADGVGATPDCAPAPDGGGTWRAAGMCDATYGPDRTTPNTDGDRLGPTQTNVEKLLCLQTDGTYTYGPPCAETTPFRREVSLQTASACEMLVISRVRWCPTPTASCPGRERVLEVHDRLRNWFPDPLAPPCA